MNQSLLFEFPHSHFCEKARWAIDYKEFPYQRKSLLPPWHMFTTKRYGKRTTVPLFLHLLRPNQVNAVQGSSEIISYLEAVTETKPLTPATSQDAIAFEKKIDRSLGVPLRVFLYHYLLPHTDYVCDAFLQNSSKAAGLMFRKSYPLVSQLIRKSYRIDKASADRALAQIFIEMDRLWTEKGQQPYFAGDQFSRLDITVGALLAFIPQPQEHPMTWHPYPACEDLQAFERQAKAHPLSLWVKEIYAKHR